MKKLHIRRDVIAFFVFAGLYLWIGLTADHLGFLSNSSAFLIEKALIMRSTLHLQSAGFIYPPLPLLIALVFPNAMWITVAGAVVTSTLAVFVLRDLFASHLRRYVVFVLLLAAFVTPVMIYLSNQELSSSLGILLVYLSFREFRKYMEEGSIHSMFLSGIWIGFAFFTAPISVYFALGFAVIVLLQNPQQSVWSRVAAVMVLLFPLVSAMVSWAYLSWLFTGKPTLVYPNELLLNWTVPQVVLGALVCVSTLVVLLWTQPKHSLFVLFPGFFMVVAPTIGLRSILEFIALLTLIAFSVMPKDLARRYQNLIAAAALVQLVGLYLTPTQQGQMSVWSTSLQTNTLSSQEAVLRQMSLLMRQAPSASILTDDRMTYRALAYAGTVQPFILPTNPKFTEIASDPGAFVDYVFVQSTAVNSQTPLRQYTQQAPKGMVLDARFDGYVLYRAIDVQPLI